jgi:hypothetical protein
MAGTAQSVHNKEGGASEHSCHEREQKYEGRDDGANFDTINKMGSNAVRKPFCNRSSQIESQRHHLFPLNTTVPA